MGCSDAHATNGQTFVCLCNEFDVSGPVRHADTIPARDAECGQRCRRDARRRQRRVPSLLKRRRTTHDRIREVDRHIGDTFKHARSAGGRRHNDAFQAVVECGREIAGQRFGSHGVGIRLTEALENYFTEAVTDHA